jgi:spore maturation protein CgeB
MKLVIFGLSVSSSWGNGHATLWRGLIRALDRAGHRVTFFERDVPYYAAHRDLLELPGGRLLLYREWHDVLSTAMAELADADAAIVTSYCPDGVPAADAMLDSAAALNVFYDLDTPVTLERLRAGEPVPYIGAGGLEGFDLVLSYTGGAALDELRDRLGARRVAPLYGSVDPATHRPVPPRPRFRSDLSYLGTYAADRQRTLERLFVEPARSRPGRRFVIAGAQYPDDFPWSDNVWFVHHLPPQEHSAFYCSSRLTLNVTRAPMAEMGWCPSGRLFEAAACGTAVLSDRWEGLEDFFRPGEEIVAAATADDVLQAMDLGDGELALIGRRARDRALAEHTAHHRAAELVALLEGALTVEA